MHNYTVSIEWIGNAGAGTRGYGSYSRDHTITAGGESNGKVLIQGSSDAHFRGDGRRYNPEELLVASLSSCHMLWYLHLCAISGIVVEAYHDDATGKMEINHDGSGQFVEVVLHPRVGISSGAPELADSLHDRAHSMCFIARSVNFPVSCSPVVLQS
jgi:organic hydroperoxide reductase OsmC/OhrA